MHGFTAVPHLQSSPSTRLLRFRRAKVVALATSLLALSSSVCVAQVFTVKPEGIDGKYLDYHPTDIPLPTAPLTNHGHADLLRFLEAEQGFSMRPLPIGTLTVHANGVMQPSGSDYANALRTHGLSVKAGERVTVTDIRIDKDHVVLELNGGPEHRHKWLRHVEVGGDPNMTTPIVRDDPQAPTGSRIVLAFAHGVPDLTGLQVEALIKPVVDFSVKTPQQAFTDTLPPFLRKTIQEHHVLVGMNTQMVISALGPPKDKVREREGQMPFEEWIYGEPPQPVQFVRFNGNRVIRVEVANVGETPVVRTENEMGDYWNTAPSDNTRIVKLGDQNPADAAAQNAPRTAPTLRNPGEKLPADDDKTKAEMKPVQFPKETGTGVGSGSQSGNSSTTASQSGSASTTSASQSASTPAASTSPTTPAPAPAPTPSIHPTMPSPDRYLAPAY